MEKLTEDQIHKKLESLQGWTYAKDAIHTSFQFEDFKDAFTVMTRIAFEAEALQHHPNWANSFNELEISLSTHDAGGVTAKDFEMAKAIEDIVEAK
ncbi:MULTISPECIES: 4a-hydroxytetrahydrobiopterin dehydratase [unclassified Zunongwangia]|uniref:4a-hydroxytetrahydrobiopterin dehydratase n=1 Tax=unclassified Zunongwangia TaxID=2632541 RepID=UPI0022DE4702|nr:MULTISPECIES: 4a-hydroxytetrahydrobiopterin dehydratase [unclassified Zunongwangia]WBL23914.1 4a-hydroxytetrahydrobiopterin dehydratase [Zunongwangia sp. HRR-M8]WBL24083.1 4a-hydroxytetrahydrobiopterin dehydratase [Zunongwangia sp. HGR-M22]